MSVNVAEVEKKISEQLTAPPEITPVKLKDLYTMSYKSGPIRREVVYKATSPEEARRIADKFVSHLNRLDNSRSVLVGLPKPFARDLEAEISDWESKNQQPKI